MVKKVRASNEFRLLSGPLRVNDQWRIVFRWEASDAHEVEINDYH